MRILIACEQSGVVRRAFRKLGHDAWSCDLQETDRPSKYHIVDDVRNQLDNDWNLMIAHPPCTCLARSGARWYKDRPDEIEAALDFVRVLMAAPIDKICIENPIGLISSRIRKPDQIIQPWQFGHFETKATCLWLKNLPVLKPTHKWLGLAEDRIYRMSPSAERARLRSRTYVGIARAMASQWHD